MTLANRPCLLQACRRRLGELFVEEGSEAGLEAHQERGAPRLSDLVNKGVEFDVCWTHPKVAVGSDVILMPLFVTFLSSYGESKKNNQ